MTLSGTELEPTNRLDGRKLISLIIIIILFLFFGSHRIRKLDKFRWRRLHGEGIFLGVETREWGGVPNEDPGEFASEASRCGDGLGLNTFADLKLKAAATILGGSSVSEINGYRLCLAAALGSSRLEGLMGGW